MRTAKTLIRLGRCPGWSETSLGAQSLCWFCHVAAYFMTNLHKRMLPDWRIEPVTSWIPVGQASNGAAGLGTHKKRDRVVWFCWWSSKCACVAIKWGKCEPRHDKTNKVSVRPVKTQISLGIRPVWSESSLSAWRKHGSLATHWAHSEDSDQTGRMPRLILVFAGHTVTLLVLSCRGSCLSLCLKLSVVPYMSRSMTKPTIWHMHPVSTRISLGIRPVWSVSAVHMKKPWGLSYSLSAQWRLFRLSGCPGWSESSLGGHISLLVLSCCGSYCVIEQRRLKGDYADVHAHLSFTVL